MDSREQFEKWVTAMEPAYADENLERLTGGRGGYRVHNVACWWMGWEKAWQASREAALTEAANFLRENGQAIHDGDMSAIDAAHAILALKGDKEKP